MSNVLLPLKSLQLEWEYEAPTLQERQEKHLKVRAGQEWVTAQERGTADYGELVIQGLEGTNTPAAASGLVAS